MSVARKPPSGSVPIPSDYLTGQAAPVVIEAAASNRDVVPVDPAVVVELCVRERELAREWLRGDGWLFNW